MAGALQKLQVSLKDEQPYAAVLVDRSTYGSEGEGFLGALSSMPEACNVPVCIISPMADSHLDDTQKYPHRIALLPRPFSRVALSKALGDVVELGTNTHKSASVAAPIESVSRYVPRVLIVEDDINSERVLQLFLQALGLGLTCTTVRNGQDAVDIFAECAFDVVFMDCHLPVMDGYCATNLIRDMGEAGRKAYIVAMTAYVMEGAREKCLSSGMDDYLSKPLNLKHVERVMADAMAKLCPK